MNYIFCPVLKLETRSSVLLLNAFSEASAGLLGTKSNMVENAEASHDSEASLTSEFCPWVFSISDDEEALATPVY